MIFNRFKIKKGIFTCFYRILIPLIERMGVKLVDQGDHWKESSKTGIYSVTQLQETTISFHFAA